MNDKPTLHISAETKISDILEHDGDIAEVVELFGVLPMVREAAAA